MPGGILRSMVTCPICNVDLDVLVQEHLRADPAPRIWGAYCSDCGSWTQALGEQRLMLLFRCGCGCAWQISASSKAWTR